MPSKMERVRQAAERVGRAKGASARANARRLEHMAKTIRTWSAESVRT